MSEPVKIVFNKPWIPYKNKVEFYISDKEAFDAPVTTVHGFFFNSKNELLLVKHCMRGWEVPGGHIEGGETFEEAMRRELSEEAQMSAGNLIQLGYLKKIALEDKPDGCSYPYPLSYCIFYASRITQVEAFVGDENISEAAFFSLSAAEKTPWIILYNEYFKAAIKVI